MKKIHFYSLILFFVSFAPILPSYSWGFFAHKNINRLAVFTLPPEMAGFYKKNLDFISEHAVAPDKRRYILKEEGARHYIDLDYYEDSLHLELPLPWKVVDSLISEDVRLKHGILPWHLMLMKWKLTDAFKSGNLDAALKISAEIGHYIADAHVPLHTCSNYNGQLTNQHGIHGLWESRLPELNFDNYDFWVGPAAYEKEPSRLFWNIIFESHALVDTVLYLEKKLTLEFPSDQKYCYEQRGNTMVKTYSREFCERYHQLLNGQIEARMKSAVKVIGSLWYTCWVDAGSPDLNFISGLSAVEKEKKETSMEDTHDCNGH